MSTGQENRASMPVAPVLDPTKPGYASHGIDVRTFIATHALQGILANERDYNDATYMGAAKAAVIHADALLKALTMPVVPFAGDDDE